MTTLFGDLGRSVWRNAVFLRLRISCFVLSFWIWEMAGWKERLEEGGSGGGRTGGIEGTQGGTDRSMGGNKSEERSRWGMNWFHYYLFILLPDFRLLSCLFYSILFYSIFPILFCSVPRCFRYVPSSIKLAINDTNLSTSSSPPPPSPPPSPNAPNPSILLLLFPPNSLPPTH